LTLAPSKFLFGIHVHPFQWLTGALFREEEELYVLHPFCASVESVMTWQGRKRQEIRRRGGEGAEALERPISGHCYEEARWLLAVSALDAP
jgi:hypothetical protein